MAKKKNKHKHTRLAKKTSARPKNASQAAAPAAAATAQPPAPLKGAPAALAPSANVQPKPGILDSSNRWYYVRGDLKRIAVLAASCTALVVVLWYLLNTPYGASVYQLIKI